MSGIGGSQVFPWSRGFDEYSHDTVIAPGELAATTEREACWHASKLVNGPIGTPAGSTQDAALQ